MQVLLRRTGFATLSFALAALLGCAATPPRPAEDEQQRTLGTRTRDATRVVAGALATGAKTAGRGLGTAYRGVRVGFQAPRAEADFGAYPKKYIALTKRYFTRFLRFPEDTRYAFGTPERGYMNEGLLQGGGVAWIGYLVEVDVTTHRRLSGLVTAQRYVVRIRDGEVEDAHTDISLLHPLSEQIAAEH